jgi:hypothetical protein
VIACESLLPSEADRLPAVITFDDRARLALGPAAPWRPSAPSIAAIALALAALFTFAAVACGPTSHQRSVAATNVDAPRSAPARSR